MSTKEKILEAALELFSTYGYEATTIGQIAESVGVRKPSLYNHFESKQDIFDTLMDEINRRYEEHSIFNRFATQDGSDINVTVDLQSIIFEVKQQLQFSLHDSHVSKVRRMLIIEQFRNPQMAAEQTRRSYEDILRYYTFVMERLISKGVLQNGDPGIMARQFFGPISMELYQCDRDPAHESQALDTVEMLIRQFFQMYKR